MQPGATTLNLVSSTSNYISTFSSPAVFSVSSVSPVSSSASVSPSVSSSSSFLSSASSSGKVLSLSFSRPPLPVSNHFGMLSEECLFPLSLSSMSKSARRRSHRKHRLSVALRISSAAVSPTILSPSVCTPILAPILLSSTHDLGSDDPITLPCTVNENHHATCMIDSGASSQFIDLDFALGLNPALDKKTTPEDLVLADRVRSKVGQITHTCTLKLMIDQHLETLTVHVTKLAGWNLIVGKPWLKRHNPTVNWTMNSVTFTSGFCHAQCLPTCTKTPDPL